MLRMGVLKDENALDTMKLIFGRKLRTDGGSIRFFHDNGLFIRHCTALKHT